MTAIYRREWRFFALPFDVSDQAAYYVFTALHVPLFVLIILNWEVATWQSGVAIFLMAHAAVHWGLRHHPLIDFNNWFSWVWIYGGGLLGAVYLAWVQVY